MIIKFTSYGTEYTFDLNEVTFRPFNDSEWESFPGCMSKMPLIGYSENTIFVVDGILLLICDTEAGQYEYISVYNLVTGRTVSGELVSRFERHD